MHFFVGNHDMWMKDYLQTELNIPVYFEPKEFVRNGKLFYIGHGDGLGPGDHGYKRLKKVFRNPACQWLFGILPPRIGMSIANYMSRKSRAQTGSTEEVFLGDDREYLLIFSRDTLLKKKVDFFVFGHRHLPIDYRLSGDSRYINLGDWISFSTYAVFDGQNMEVKSYTGRDAKIVRK
jgi:UDP-2,3-diacylglucosamine hydrolase